MAQFRIDQIGLSPGAIDKARTDGLPDGSLVTLTSVGTTSIRFQLLWVPPDDNTAVASLQEQSPGVWTFTPTANAYGTYRIQMIQNEGSTNEQRVTRWFSVRTPAGIVIPPLNAIADATASLINSGEAQIIASEDNSLDYGGSLDDLPYAGWWRAMHEAFMSIGSGGGSLIEADSNDLLRYCVTREALTSNTANDTVGIYNQGATAGSIPGPGTDDDLYHYINDNDGFPVFGFPIAAGMNVNPLEDRMWVSTVDKHLISRRNQIPTHINEGAGFTISGWFLMQSQAGSNDVLFAKEQTFGTGDFDIILGIGSGDYLYAGTDVGTVNEVQIDAIRLQSTEGVLYHLGIAINAAQTLSSFYANGQLVGVAPVSGLVANSGLWTFGGTTAASSRDARTWAHDIRCANIERGFQYFRDVWESGKGFLY